MRWDYDNMTLSENKKIHKLTAIVFIGIVVGIIYVNTFDKQKAVASNTPTPEQQLDYLLVLSDLADYRIDNQKTFALRTTSPEAVVPQKVVSVANTETVTESEIEEIKEALDIPTEVSSEFVFIDENAPYSVSYFESSAIWNNRYGILYASNGKLFVGAADSGTASSALINDGGEWTNYKASVVFDWHRGSSFSLTFRYQDSDNYAYCGYSLYGSRVTMYKVVDGEKTALGKSPRLGIPVRDPWKDVHVQVEVIGDRATCMVDDEILLFYTLDDIPPTGGIAIRTWAPEKGYSLMGIKHLVITGM